MFNECEIDEIEIVEIDSITNEEIMERDIEKIPLLNEAMKQNTQTKGEVYLSGKLISMKDLSKIAIKVLMPPGWENYNKE